MIISSTFFPKRDILKTTWLSPAGLTTNQIDHILTDKRAATYVTNVKVRRRAMCGSDHLILQVQKSRKADK